MAALFGSGWNSGGLILNIRCDIELLQASAWHSNVIDDPMES